MTTTPPEPQPGDQAQQPSQPEQPPYQQSPQYQQPPHYQQPTQYQQAPQYAQPPQGQYQYGAPQGFAPAPGPNPAQAKNWMGTTSLVLSLAGLITGITAIAGIVLGHLSLSAVKRGEADNRSMGLAGLITGYVLVGLGILGTILAVVFFGALFGSLVEECTGDDPPAWCTEDGASIQIEAFGMVTGVPAR